MRERSIKVRLLAEVADFQRQMASSARSLDDFEKAAKKTGGTADTTLGRLAQSAQINSAEWQQVGSALLKVGTGITAVGTAALVTGVNYNTMQQKSRAALTTMLGSAEAVNAQMSQFDDFARNSPFARQTFLQAQQQMLGFGIEARKVIPYLDSIQDAVAATGGSNQQISELSLIFSQIQAAAKITGTDLMQFAQRGVDAAGLIGQHMGYTSAEIREQITAGALDAGVALDALAEGMKIQYGGAAAAVKETFDGAWDRVKAAWRDLSSELATPLVNPEGGGLLIDWLNSLADAMRGFQDAPAPLKWTVAALGALTAAGTLTAGGLMVAVPRMVAFNAALTTLTNTHPRLATFAGRMTGAAGAVGKFALRATPAIAVGLALGKALDAISGPGRTAALGVEEVTAALRSGSIEDIAGRYTGAMSSVSDALELLAGKSFDSHMERLGSGLNNLLGGHFSDQVNDARQLFEELDGAIASMVSSGNLDEAAASFAELELAAAANGVTTEQLLDLMPQYREALAGVENETVDVATSTWSMDDALEGLTGASASARDSLIELGERLRGVRESFLDWSAALSESDGSLSSWLDNIERQNQALRNWDANMTALVNRGATPELMRQLEDLGVEGAAAVELLANGTEEDLARANAAASETDGLMQGLGLTYDGLAEKSPIKIEIDGYDAYLEFNSLTQEWEEHVVRTPWALDEKPATTTFEGIAAEFQSRVTPTQLDLDASAGELAFNYTTGEWERTTTSTNLGLDNDAAEMVFNYTTGRWDRRTTNTNLGANTSPATASFNSTTGIWARRTTNTNLGVNTSRAQTAVDGFFAYNRNRSLVLNIAAAVSSVSGNYHGGWVNPGLASGGWVPGQRAGYDNVLWPVASKGKLLAQPLEGQEFVVNSAMARRYAGELEAINRGTFLPARYGGGGVGDAGGSSVPAATLARLHPDDIRSLAREMGSAVYRGMTEQTSGMRYLDTGRN